MAETEIIWKERWKRYKANKWENDVNKRFIVRQTRLTEADIISSAWKGNAYRIDI